MAKFKFTALLPFTPLLFSSLVTAAACPAPPLPSQTITHPHPTPSSATFPLPTSSSSSHYISSTFHPPSTTLSPPSSSSSSGTTTPKCTPGTPVTVGQEGFVITFVPVIPSPTLSPTDNVGVDSTWGSQWFLGNDELFIGSDMKPYALFKCQFQCSASNGCRSWFMAWDITRNFWSCTQYSSLIPPSVLIAANNSTLKNGEALDALCPPSSSTSSSVVSSTSTSSSSSTSTSSSSSSVRTSAECTSSGSSVVLTTGLTVSFASVTPAISTTVSPTNTGILPIATWDQQHRIGEQDILLTQAQQNEAIYTCQFNCTVPVGCASWFVGFLVKGGGGFYWQCIWYNELLTPDILQVSDNAYLRNGTGWDRICS